MNVFLVGLALGLMPSQPSSPHWICTWTAAPQLTEPRNMPPSPGFSDATVRQTIHISLGGKAARFHFSNTFSKSPLTLRAARLAKPTALGGIDTKSDLPITFSGRTSITIPPGAEMTSDSIRLVAPSGSDLTVTIYVQDSSSSITGHPGSRCTTFFTTGNHVSEVEFANAVQTQHWYYLSSVDVDAPAEAKSIGIVGDSITDGRGSTTDQNRRWPDFLSALMQKNPATRHLSIFNQGIGGNRVLNDELGPSLLARFDRDVLARPGIATAIVFEGINDLGTKSGAAGPASQPQIAEDLISAFSELIDRAHGRNIRVLGATITPCGQSFYFSDDLEAARQTVNRWIRTSGRFDGVLDFDKAVQDPSHPLQLLPTYDSGDHLHLSDEGYRRLAESVPVKFLTR